VTVEIVHDRAPAAGPRSGLARRLLAAPAPFVGAALFLAGGILLAFLYAPTDSSTMGFSQKIFYYHAPIAETALLAFTIAFVAAIAYLRTHDARYDRLGFVCVRLGLLFSLLVMATGMIWGRAAWGAWWDWEPRLTTFLLVCVMYTAYFVLRQTVEEETRRATFAALFAIVAFVDVPITFFATRFLPAGMHPVVFHAGGASMDHSMLLSFLVSMAGMTLLLIAMIRSELQAETIKEELRDIKDRMGG
jgi:heme exporter protein C